MGSEYFIVNKKVLWPHYFFFLQTPESKKPAVRRVFLIGTWQCPTLTWGNPTLPSALIRFTSEFGMESGGTVSLWLPGKTGNNLENWISIQSWVTVFSLYLRLFSELSLSTTLRSLKLLGRCMVKPLGQLVQVSLTPYNASTPCLSTSSSITTLPDLKGQGWLIFGPASRLDAFSGYPFRT